MVREPLVKDILEIQVKALEAALDAAAELNHQLRNEIDDLQKTVERLTRVKYPDVPPHQRKSDTSREAALSIKKFNDKTKELLRHFYTNVGGLTDEEGQIEYGIQGNLYRPMRVTLMHLGLVEDSGIRRRTQSKKNAVVWTITELGRVKCVG